MTQEEAEEEFEEDRQTTESDNSQSSRLNAEHDC
jgi:hypothetical protein